MCEGDNIPSLSYRYIKEHGLLRPKIPIIVSAGELRTEVAGLIDSGSDFVLFPKDIAEAVGITLTKKVDEADGVGGRIRCRSGLATITLQKGKTKKILTNMKIFVQTDEGGIDEILLGRIPFFEHFRIEFNENAKRVKLTPNRRPLKVSFEQKSF